MLPAQLLSLLLWLLQASAVALATVMNWKNTVFWDCCSGCTPFFWGLLFPEVREGFKLFSFYFLSLQCLGNTHSVEEKGKRSCFFWRGSWGLAGAWRWTVVGQKAQWRGQRSVWSRRGRGAVESGISGVKQTGQGWPWGVCISVLCEVVQRRPRVLGLFFHLFGWAEDMSFTPVWVSFKCLLMVIILGDLQDTQTENHPFF